MRKAHVESKEVEAKSKAGRLDAMFSSERASRILYLLIGAAVIALVFRHLQFSTASICCGDYDGYYHIKWSQMLWGGIKSRHFPPAFTWLPLTTLDQNGYVDHHLLFHILQIPFTWFGNLTLGAKVAATLFGSLAVFSCYWLTLHYRIKYSLVWLIALLACSGAFLYRLNMAKAPPLAIIFMVVGIYLLFEKKYWMLGPLMFLFVWTYSLFPTLLFAALIWAGVVGWCEERVEWRPVVWTLVGMIAGLVVNPYFPRNIWLFIEHARMKLTFGDFSTSVGQEWYSYDSWVFLSTCFGACVAMLVGYIAFNGSDRKRSAHSLFFLVFSTLLMVATMKSKRFAEYWPPFAVLFAAFSLQPIFDGARGVIGSLPDDVLDELKPFLDRHELAETEEAEKQRELWKTLVAGGITAALFIVMLVNIKGIERFKINGVAGEIKSSDGPNKYRDGMKWISQNVPAGERIFNTDWDDFPKMFFYDPSHSYISGLDPTYLFDKNQELAKLYDEVTLGKVDDPALIIRDRFGSRYVFSDQEKVHDDLYVKAMASGWFDKAYEDDDCVILHIRDQKGEPPPESAEDNAPDDASGATTNEGEEDMPPEEDNAP
jgi:hypothetical protein